MKKNNRLSVIMLVITTLLCITIVVLAYTINNLLAKSDDKKKTEKLVSNTGTQIYKSENNNYISYIVEDYERNLTYTWQFEKDEEKNNSISKNIELNVNLRLNIDAKNDNTKKINEKVEQKKLIVTFDHEGKLPTKAIIRINVSNKFANGDRLYLYYYNPTTKNAEYIDDNLKVEDGYVEFKIDHCSDYFLTGAIVNDAVNNPKSINYIIIGLIVVVLILVAINLKQSKK